MQTGSIVECVSNPDPEDRQLAEDHGCQLATKGNIYTVRDMLFEYNLGYITLEEIRNPIPFGYSKEPHFPVHAFRELQPPLSVTEFIEECQVKHMESSI